MYTFFCEHDEIYFENEKKYSSFLGLHGFQFH